MTQFEVAVAGINMPNEVVLPPGPHRQLTAVLHELYLGAGKPGLRTISGWIRDRDDLPGTLSHQGVRDVLGGRAIPRWPNLESLVRVLLDQQRIGQRDAPRVLAELLTLWSDAQNPSPPHTDTAAPPPEPAVQHPPTSPRTMPSAAAAPPPSPDGRPPQPPDLNSAGRKVNPEINRAARQLMEEANQRLNAPYGGWSAAFVLPDTAPAAAPPKSWQAPPPITTSALELELDRRAQEKEAAARIPPSTSELQQIRLLLQRLVNQDPSTELPPSQSI
ncbi:hypothetical protein [Nocardia sp. NPDC005745]|uniref:hypothetical protein n=1 Tax=Nocardia sp. NPDC005745 TaxID=3157061 RepID=UPI0033EE944C